jgi:hypothetical protein
MDFFMFILIFVVVVVVLLKKYPFESEEKFKLKIGDLLESRQFKEANHETQKYLVYLTQGSSKNRLRLDDICMIPCKKLWEIDQLWNSKSFGKFGYSAQKKVIDKYGIDIYIKHKQVYEYLNSSPRDSRTTAMCYDGFACRVGWLDFSNNSDCTNNPARQVRFINYFSFLKEEKGIMTVIDLRHIWLTLGVHVDKYSLLPVPRLNSELIDDLETAPVGHYPAWIDSNPSYETRIWKGEKIKADPTLFYQVDDYSKNWVSKIMECF